MALNKKITAANGIELNYHRIALINIDINQQITILVRSYLNEDARNYEKDYAAGLIKEPVFPYTMAEYKHIDFNEAADILKGDIITAAYNWLKNQPEYIGAEDV